MKTTTTIELIVALFAVATGFAAVFWPPQFVAVPLTLFMLFVILVLLRVCNWLGSVDKDLSQIMEIIRKLNIR